MPPPVLFLLCSILFLPCSILFLSRSICSYTIFPLPYSVLTPFLSCPILFLHHSSPALFCSYTILALLHAVPPSISILKFTGVFYTFYPFLKCFVTNFLSFKPKNYFHLIIPYFSPNKILFTLFADIFGSVSSRPKVLFAPCKRHYYRWRYDGK